MAVKREERKPGVMVYFDVIPAIEIMPVEECGELFLSILKYARDKVEPAHKGDATRYLWEMIRQRIDHDDERYSKICTDRRYNAYVRSRKKAGKEALEFEEWVERLTDEQ